MAKRKGLGRGLDALLSARPGDAVASDADTAAGSLQELPIDLIERGRYQPRIHMDQDKLEELAQSIRSNGVIQPIVVRPLPGGKRYELIAGERRWRAAQLAELGKIPVVIRELDDEAALGVAIIENIQREDLNPVEEALGFRRLIDEFEMTHQAIATAVGRSRASVSNLLRLLDLEEEVRDRVERGDLEMGHARALLGLNAAVQVAAAARVSAEGLNVRQTEALVRKLKSAAETPPREAPRIDPDIRRLQDDLTGRLGAPVQIDHKDGGKGKLIIRYDSLDQLDGILEKMR